MEKYFYKDKKIIKCSEIDKEQGYIDITFSVFNFSQMLS